MRRRSFLMACLAGGAASSAMAEATHQSGSFSQLIQVTPDFARAAFLVPATNASLHTELPGANLLVLSDGISRVQINLMVGPENIVRSDYDLAQDQAEMLVSCKITQDTGKLRALNMGRGLPISGDEPAQIIESLKRFTVKGELFARQLPEGARVADQMTGVFGAAFLIASICLLSGATSPEFGSR